MFDNEQFFNTDEYDKEIKEIIEEEKRELIKSIKETEKYFKEHICSKDDILKARKIAIDMINYTIKEIMESSIGDLTEDEKEYLIFLHTSRFKVENLFDKYLK